MNRRRCLFVLSNDFGEYVTASLFARGQPFESHFALPARLAAYAGGADGSVSTYENVGALRELAQRLRPEVVLLCSGYLFAVNGLIAPEALAQWLAALRRDGAAVATTDPWLRIWAMRPGAKFTLHSVRQGGVDAERSARMSRLQAALEGIFRDLPHVFGVPLRPARDTWMSFYNQTVVGPSASPEIGQGTGTTDDWLFVLSREDYVFLAGLDGERFFDALADRIRELAGERRNRLTFIAPPELGAALRQRIDARGNVQFVPFCDFATFEATLRRAKLVVYWNVLSASLLYCLYYGVPPVFLGRGHQARVCEGLFEHAAGQVFLGQAPALLNAGESFGTGADALIERLGIRPWLAWLRQNYAQAPSPAAVVERILAHHAG